MSCEQHKKEVAGISDMKVLAEMIGDLHFEAMAELYKHLAGKHWMDSFKDANDGKKDVAAQLKYIHHAMVIAGYGAERAWQISKPFMLSSEQNPDECDATKDGSSNAAGQTNKKHQSK